MLNFVILLKFSHFLSLLTTREELVHSVCSDNDLVLFRLRWKETRLTDKKVSKSFVRGYSSSEVGSVKTCVEKVTTS